MSAIDPDDRPPLTRGELIERLRRWFSQGRSQQARYLVVAQDVFDSLRPDYDYGVYAKYAAGGTELQQLLKEDARRKSDPWKIVSSTCLISTGISMRNSARPPERNSTSCDKYLVRFLSNVAAIFTTQDQS